jgi:hypothetical protein
MERSPFTYRLSHLAVRVIAGINIVDLFLSFYPPYFHAENRLFPQGGEVYWRLASSFLLPLYVGFEEWWMFRAEPPQRKALLIDWLLALLWFVIWWTFLLRSLYLYYPNL